MAGPVVLAVQILGVHVDCELCGQTATVHTADDAFTDQVLQPLAGWFTGHRAPRIVQVDVLANGALQQWVAS